MNGSTSGWREAPGATIPPRKAALQQQLFVVLFVCLFFQALINALHLLLSFCSSSLFCVGFTVKVLFTFISSVPHTLSHTPDTDFFYCAWILSRVFPAVLYIPLVHNICHSQLTGRGNFITQGGYYLSGTHEITAQYNGFVTGFPFSSSNITPTFWPLDLQQQQQQQDPSLSSYSCFVPKTFKEQGGLWWDAKEDWPKEGSVFWDGLMVKFNTIKHNQGYSVAVIFQRFQEAFLPLI